MIYVCTKRPYPFIELTRQPFQGKHVSFMPDGQLDTLATARRIGVDSTAIEEAVRADPMYGVTIFEADVLAGLRAEAEAQARAAEPPAQEPPATAPAAEETPDSQPGSDAAPEHAPPTVSGCPECPPGQAGCPKCLPTEAGAVEEAAEGDHAPEGGELKGDD